MNAARPIFAAPFASASLPATPAAPAAPREKSRGKARRAKSSKPTPAAPEAVGDEYSACLVQARICREQAHEAARLRRFQAAVGLFQTAISLCQRAMTLRKAPAPELAAQDAPAQAAQVTGDGASDGEAREYLQVLAVELSAYDELARSMNRPLRDHGR